MKPVTYTPSKLLTGKVEPLRQHSLTRWMSPDLTQAAVDFCRHLGLVPVYCECSPDRLTRYLFWQPPTGATFEVRSGRTREKFLAFAAANHDRHWPLLSLHVNVNDLHSAVWVSADHFAAARAFLAAHGITPAKRHEPRK